MQQYSTAGSSQLHKKQAHVAIVEHSLFPPPHKCSNTTTTRAQLITHHRFEKYLAKTDAIQLDLNWARQAAVAVRAADGSGYGMRHDLSAIIPQLRLMESASDSSPTLLSGLRGVLATGAGQAGPDIDRLQLEVWAWARTPWTRCHRATTLHGWPQVWMREGVTLYAHAVRV